MYRNFFQDRLSEYCLGSVLIMDPLNLAGGDIRRSIPLDLLELASTSVLRVSFAVGVPVNPLKWILIPIGRV